MGRLTVDMTRLVGEIQAGHGERRRLNQALRQPAVELRSTVGRMQTSFRAAHAEMTRRQRRGLREFVSGLQGRVGALRHAFSTDLAGARLVWHGAAPSATAVREHSKRTGKLATS